MSQVTVPDNRPRDTLVEGKIGAKVVDQACAVLYELGAAHRPRSTIGVRELADRLRISKTTVQRILVSLHRGRLLEFDATSRKYALGPGILRLAAAFPRTTSLVEIARPLLLELRRHTQETVALSTIGWRARVTVFQMESPLELRFVTEVGRPYPLVLGATGQVLLAALSPADCTDILEGYARDAQLRALLDGRTVAPDRLAADVAAVRSRGYAVTHGHWIPGGAGVAVPVRQPGGAPFAVSLYGPSLRLTDGAVRRLLPALRAAAGGIEAQVQEDSF